VLETRDLTIRFGGHVAVDRVSCAFQPGTLTAIVGPNGAGKTTYFNLISGQLRASAGSVWLDGHDITSETVSARTHRGLGRAFQLTQLFPNLSVLENVRLAVQSRRHEGLNLFAVWLDRRETLARARELVERVRLGERADAPASSLPHGDQRKLEVAMLIALEPSVYMFDEPTAGMSVDDVPVILDLVRGLKAERDKTILLVEHKMDVVRELADRIIVLHNGQLVADGEPAEVIASPIVQQAYLGLAPEVSLSAQEGRPLVRAFPLEGEGAGQGRAAGRT
jgi:branched-chain amino acid transport system ATP-binding protein